MTEFPEYDCNTAHVSQRHHPLRNTGLCVLPNAPCAAPQPCSGSLRCFYPPLSTKSQALTRRRLSGGFFDQNGWSHSSTTSLFTSLARRCWVPCPRPTAHASQRRLCFVLSQDYYSAWARTAPQKHATNSHRFVTVLCMSSALTNSSGQTYSPFGGECSSQSSSNGSIARSNASSSSAGAINSVGKKNRDPNLFALTTFLVGDMSVAPLGANFTSVPLCSSCATGNHVRRCKLYIHCDPILQHHSCRCLAALRALSGRWSSSDVPERFRIGDVEDMRVLHTKTLMCLSTCSVSRRTHPRGG